MTTKLIVFHLLVEPRMEPIPAGLETHEFDTGVVVVDDQGKQLAKGRHVGIIAGEEDEIKEWLRPFNGVWVGLGTPAHRHCYRLTRESREGLEERQGSHADRQSGQIGVDARQSAPSYLDHIDRAVFAVERDHMCEVEQKQEMTPPKTCGNCFCNLKPDEKELCDECFRDS